MKKEVLGKYSDNVLKNIDEYNFKQIILFLEKEKCDFIEELVSDYLDLFTIDYFEFERKYNKLNQKYKGSYLKLVRKDMNYLEEIFSA